MGPTRSLVDSGQGFGLGVPRPDRSVALAHSPRRRLRPDLREPSTSGGQPPRYFAPQPGAPTVASRPGDNPRKSPRCRADPSVTAGTPLKGRRTSVGRRRGTQAWTTRASPRLRYERSRQGSDRSKFHVEPRRACGPARVRGRLSISDPAIQRVKWGSGTARVVAPFFVHAGSAHRTRSQRPAPSLGSNSGWEETLDQRPRRTSTSRGGPARHNPELGIIHASGSPPMPYSVCPLSRSVRVGSSPVCQVEASAPAQEGHRARFARLLARRLGPVRRPARVTAAARQAA